MSRADRRRAGDHRPLVQVPEGEGDEPRIQMTQDVIDYIAQSPGGPNPYQCKACGQLTITVHLHHGVTPMFLACKRCGGEAVSAMYPDGPIPAELAHEAVWEWYRPGQDEYGRLVGARRDHIDRGGVMLRLRQPATRFTDPVAGPTVPAELREETDSEKRDRVARVFGARS